MKAYVVFYSNEPVLVLTRTSIRHQEILKELRRIGCLKFIAREVPVERLRDRYGRQFEVIEESLRHGCDLRVLDYSGRRIFRQLPFSEFGPAYRHESPPITAKPRQEPTRHVVRSSPAVGSPALFG
jgi:hypothetical protein